MSDSQIRPIRPATHIPIAHAVVCQGMVHVSGQVGFKPGTTALVSDDLEEQCRQTFANIDELLREAGADREHIVMIRIYLRHCERDFAAMNRCFSQWMGNHRPARTTVGVEFALPGILIEVDCTAVMPSGR
jgi:2-iminobutanoate/2-iminopropanoate deaminase